MNKYGLRGEFGDVFFTGTKSEVNQVKNAMIAYGILDRKLHIVEPKYSDYKMPENIYISVYDEVVEHLAEGMSYSDYTYEMAKNYVNEMTDYDLFSKYEEIVHSDDDNNYLKRMNEAFNSYKAEKILLEE